jgi:hypothetical protein
VKDGHSTNVDCSNSLFQRIGSEAVAHGNLFEVVLPDSLTEVDPSAFDDDTWRRVRWIGTRLLLAKVDLLLAPDSSILYRSFSSDFKVIHAGVQVIARRAFSDLVSAIGFENGTTVKEIGEDAFYRCGELTRFTVPASVEVINAFSIARNWQ